MSNIEIKKEFSQEKREELLKALKARFELNINHHKDVNGK